MWEAKKKRTIQLLKILLPAFSREKLLAILMKISILYKQSLLKFLLLTFLFQRKVSRFQGQSIF